MFGNFQCTLFLVSQDSNVIVAANSQGQIKVCVLVITSCCSSRRLKASCFQFHSHCLLNVTLMGDKYIFWFAAVSHLETVDHYKILLPRLVMKFLHEINSDENCCCFSVSFFFLEDIRNNNILLKKNIKRTSRHNQSTSISPKKIN